MQPSQNDSPMIEPQVITPTVLPSQSPAAPLPATPLPMEPLAPAVGVPAPRAPAEQSASLPEQPVQSVVEQPLVMSPEAQVIAPTTQEPVSPTPTMPEAQPGPLVTVPDQSSQPVVSGFEPIAASTFPSPAAAIPMPTQTARRPLFSPDVPPVTDYAAPATHAAKRPMILAVTGVLVFVLASIGLYSFVSSRTSSLRSVSSHTMAAMASGDQSKFDQVLSPDLKSVLDGSPGTEATMLSYTKNDLANGYKSQSTYQLNTSGKEYGAVVYTVKSSDKAYMGLLFQKTDKGWKLETANDQSNNMTAEQFMKENSVLTNN